MKRPSRCAAVAWIPIVLLAGCSAVGSAPATGRAASQASDELGSRRSSIGVHHTIYDDVSYTYDLTDASGTTSDTVKVETRQFGIDYEFPWGERTSAYVGLQTLDFQLAGESWGVTLGGRYYWKPMFEARPFLFTEVTRVAGLQVEATPDRDPMFLLGFGLGLSYPFAERYTLEALLMHRDILGPVETDQGDFSAKEKFDGPMGLLALRWYF